MKTTKRQTKVPRPRSLRQAFDEVVSYEGRPHCADFIDQLRRDRVRVHIELHGAADINGTIAWAASNNDDVFVVEQDKIGLKLIRISSVISVSKAPPR